MQIHELKRTSNAKTKKRVGRGGKKGTYSGRGGKGQTARAGSKVKPLIRELIKRYPKARGTRAQIRRDFVMIVQTKDLERAYPAGGEVNMETLMSHGLVSRVKGRIPAVKILGSIALAKAFVVAGCKVSAQAKAAIEKAGGKVS